MQTATKIVPHIVLIYAALLSLSSFKSFMTKFAPLRTAERFGTIPNDESRKAGVTETRRKFFALSGGYPAALAL